MKEVTVPQTTYKQMFKAVDGTIFDNATECMKYETSAVGVLLNRLVPIHTISKDKIGESDEIDLKLIEIKDESDLTNLQMLGEIFHFNVGNWIGKIVMLQHSNYDIHHLDWMECTLLDDYIEALTGDYFKLVPKYDEIPDTVDNVDDLKY